MPVDSSNTLHGTVTQITRGPLNSQIKLDIGAGQLVTSLMTTDNLNGLGLVKGSAANVVFRATRVLLQVG